MTTPSEAAEVPDLAEAMLWRRLRQEGAAEARQALFDLHCDFATAQANRQARTRAGADLDWRDLRQMAYAGLLEAIDRFDPDRGVPFRGYAARRIKGVIIDGVSRLSELREQVSYRGRARVERTRSLAGPPPEDLTGAAALKWLADLATGLALGFMLEGEGLAVRADQTDSRPGAYESLAWKDTVRQVRRALEDLPLREAEVLRRHYFEGLTFEQIGALLGVTKGRISQLHRAALERLRSGMTSPANFTLER